MAAKQVNLRLDEAQISATKDIARIFNKSFTDIVRDALDSYIAGKKKDPYYILTSNVQEVSDAENEELSIQLEELTEDDLKIVKTEEIDQ